MRANARTAFSSGTTTPTALPTPMDGSYGGSSVSPVPPPLLLSGLRLSCSGYLATDTTTTALAPDAHEPAVNPLVTDLDAFKDRMRELGARIDDGITRRTDLLVVWRGLTRKRRLADRHRIAVVTPEALLTAVNDAKCAAGAATVTSGTQANSIVRRLLSPQLPPPPLLHGYVFGATQFARAEAAALGDVLRMHGAELVTTLTERCDALFLSTAHAGALTDALRRLPLPSALKNCTSSASVTNAVAHSVLTELAELSSAKLLFAWQHDVPVLSYEKFLSLAGLAGSSTAVPVGDGVDFDTIIATARLEIPRAVLAKLSGLPLSGNDDKPEKAIRGNMDEESKTHMEGSSDGSYSSGTASDGGVTSVEEEGEKKYHDHLLAASMADRSTAAASRTFFQGRENLASPFRLLNPPLLTIFLVGCTGREARDGARMALAARFQLSPVPSADVDVVVIGCQAARRRRLPPPLPPVLITDTAATTFATTADTRLGLSGRRNRRTPSPLPPLRAAAAAAHRWRENHLQARREAREDAAAAPISSPATADYVYEVPHELIVSLRDGCGVGVHRIAPMAWLRACYRIVVKQAEQRETQHTYGYSETFAGAVATAETLDGGSGIAASHRTESSYPHHHRKKAELRGYDGMVESDYEEEDEAYDQESVDDGEHEHDTRERAFDPRTPIPFAQLPRPGADPFRIVATRPQPSAFTASATVRATTVINSIVARGTTGVSGGSNSENTSRHPVEAFASLDKIGASGPSDRRGSSGRLAPLPPSSPPPPPFDDKEERKAATQRRLLPEPEADSATTLVLERQQAASRLREMLHLIYGDSDNGDRHNSNRECDSDSPCRVFAGSVLCFVDGAFSRPHLAAVRGLVRHGGGTCLKLSEAQWRLALSCGDSTATKESLGEVLIDDEALARVKKAITLAVKRRRAGAHSEIGTTNMSSVGVATDSRTSPIVVLVEPHCFETDPAAATKASVTPPTRATVASTAKLPLRHLPVVTSEYLLACLAAGQTLSPALCPLFHTPLRSPEEVQLQRRQQQQQQRREESGPLAGAGIGSNRSEHHGTNGAYKPVEQRPVLSPWLRTRRYEKERSVGVCVYPLWLLPPSSQRGQKPYEREEGKGKVKDTTEALTRVLSTALSHAVHCLGGTIVDAYRSDTVTHALVVDLAGWPLQQRSHRDGDNANSDCVISGGWPASIVEAKDALRDAAAGTAAVVSLAWLMDSLHWGVFILEDARELYNAAILLQHCVSAAAAAADNEKDANEERQKSNTSTPVRAFERAAAGIDSDATYTPDLAGRAFHFHTPGCTPRPSGLPTASPTPSQPVGTPRRLKNLRQASQSAHSTGRAASVHCLRYGNSDHRTGAGMAAAALPSESPRGCGRADPRQSNTPHSHKHSCDPHNESSDHSNSNSCPGDTHRTSNAAAAAAPPALVLSSADHSLSQPPLGNVESVHAIAGAITRVSVNDDDGSDTEEHRERVSEHSDAEQVTHESGEETRRSECEAGVLTSSAGQPRLAHVTTRPSPRPQDAVDVNAETGTSQHRDASRARPSPAKAKQPQRRRSEEIEMEAHHAGEQYDVRSRTAAPGPLRVYVIGDLPHRAELIRGYVEAVAAMPSMLPRDPERQGEYSNGAESTSGSGARKRTRSADVTPTAAYRRGGNNSQHKQASHGSRDAHDATATASNHERDQGQDLVSGEDRSITAPTHGGPLLLLHDAIEKADCLVTHDISQRETVLAAVAGGLWVVRPDFLIAVADALRRDRTDAGGDSLVGGRHSLALTRLLAWHEWTPAALPAGRSRKGGGDIGGCAGKNHSVYARALVAQCGRRRRAREAAAAMGSDSSNTGSGHRHCQGKDPTSGQLFAHRAFALIFPNSSAAATERDDEAEKKELSKDTERGIGGARHSATSPPPQPRSQVSRIARQQAALRTVLRCGGGRIACMGTMDTAVTLVDDIAVTRSPFDLDQSTPAIVPLWLEQLTRIVVTAIASGRPAKGQGRPSLRHEPLTVLLDASLLPREARFVRDGAGAERHPLRQLFLSPLAAVATSTMTAAVYRWEEGIMASEERQAEAGKSPWPAAVGFFWRAVHIARRRLLTDYAVAVAVAANDSSCSGAATASSASTTSSTLAASATALVSVPTASARNTVSSRGEEGTHPLAATALASVPVAAATPAGWAEALVQSVWQEEASTHTRRSHAGVGSDSMESDRASARRTGSFVVPSSLTLADMACVALEIAGLPAYTEESGRFYGCVGSAIES